MLQLPLRLRNCPLSLSLCGNF